MEREKQKQEAIRRMKLLKIYPATIREFATEDVVNKSEHGGILYWLDEEEQEMIRKFEKKFQTVVYHVIHSYTDFGELYSLLFVSRHEDEWEYDLDDIKQNEILSYVINKDDDACSEFGMIGIQSRVGGVARIY